MLVFFLKHIQLFPVSELLCTVSPLPKCFPIALSMAVFSFLSSNVASFSSCSFSSLFFIRSFLIPLLCFIFITVFTVFKYGVHLLTCLLLECCSDLSYIPRLGMRSGACINVLSSCHPLTSTNIQVTHCVPKALGPGPINGLFSALLYSPMNSSP